jgi:hypothetical protein
MKLTLMGVQMQSLHRCLNKHWAKRWTSSVLPVTSMDLTTLFTTGSTAKTIIWTSGLFLAHLGIAKSTSDVQELMQSLYSDATRIKDVDPSNFVNALLRSIHGTETGYLLQEHTEAARELVCSAYRSRNIPSRLLGRIDDLAIAIKTNAAHCMLLITDDSHIGLSYIPSPEMGICQQDIVAKLFRSSCCSLSFILRPIDDSYHEMINIVSMLPIEGNPREKLGGYDNYYEYLFYLPPSSPGRSITRGDLQELKAQYRQYEIELYAIK